MRASLRSFRVFALVGALLGGCGDGGGSEGGGGGTGGAQRHACGPDALCETESLVWRGMATNITVSPNPDKMMKRIDKSLAKIVKASQKAQQKAAKDREKAAG